MFTLGTVILIAVIALVIGCVAGAILGRNLNPQDQYHHELEERLQNAEDKLGDYQQEVADHFAATSQLVNNLTQSYKDVHQHLANGAFKLSDPEISQQLSAAGEGNLTSANTEQATTTVDIQPPRDWAPKTPGSAGALSEEYGIEDNNTSGKAASGS